MKKQENQYKTYINLSKNESDLLNNIENILVFSTSILNKKTGWKYSKIKNTLTSLKKKKIILPIIKNNYVIKTKIPENLFCIANNIINPSYVSFWTAFSYYGCTEQQIKSIQTISPKQYKNIHFDNILIETTTFKSKEFFGYKRINNFVIAEKEKLIIDSLYKPEKVGGIDELNKCIKNIWKEINQKKLLEYLQKFDNKSLYARLGYLLEYLKLPNNYKNIFLKNLPLSYTKLNPRKKERKNYNKKWMVLANDQ